MLAWSKVEEIEVVRSSYILEVSEDRPRVFFEGWETMEDRKYFQKNI
jgi:hypothetical protein